MSANCGLRLRLALFSSGKQGFGYPVGTGCQGNKVLQPRLSKILLASPKVSSPAADGERRAVNEDAARTTLNRTSNVTRGRYRSLRENYDGRCGQYKCSLDRGF